MPLISNLTIKDWVIFIAVVILVACLLQIRRLKNIIALKIRKQLIPQLTLELVLGKASHDTGFYLKNESFFLARDIKAEDLALTLDDYGFRVNYFFKFQPLEHLKPQERVKLQLKVFDKNQEFLAEVTDAIIPHLISPAFKVRLRFTNIENITFCITFSKKREKFSIESIEPCQ